MSTTLFKHEMKKNGKLLLIFIAVLAMYDSVIVAMFDPALGKSLNEMAASMPQLFAAFGMLNVGATLLEFLANYLYGFLLIALPIVFIILLANRLVAQYVDRGSMACLLAAPVQRRTLMATQGFVLLANLVLLVLGSMVVCLTCSEAMFPGALELPAFLVLNVGLLGLLVFLGGLCFLFSCMFNDAKWSNGCSTALCVAFLLLQMLSDIGEDFAFLQYATPLTLFDVDGLLAGTHEAYAYMAILYAAGLLMAVVGAFIFTKRDVPV